jgi:RsiW-degrading membrane proteinase PrsW (M82 family)
MAELGLDQWYLSTEAGERGPMPWMLLEQTVRAARAEDSASVRRADAVAWTAFRAMAVAAAPTAVLTPPAPAVPPAAATSPPVVDPESQRFCDTAVKMGLLQADAARQVLEQQRMDRAIGYDKSVLAYLQERGFLSIEQIAKIAAAAAASKSSASGGAATGQRGFFDDRGTGASLSLATLFPVRAWLADRPWTLRWVRWFAFYALFPVVLGEIFRNRASLGDTVWALGFYFAVISGFVLYVWLQPKDVPTGRVIAVAAFTAALGGSLVLAGQKLPVVRQLYAITESPGFITRWLGNCLGVGVLEESAKALPIYWLVIHKKTPASLRQCAFLGVVSGLAFGVAEAVIYSYAYAGQHMYGMLAEVVANGNVNSGLYAQYLVAESTRLLSLPLLHGLFAGLLAFFIGLAANLPAVRTSLLWIGLLVAAVLHGTYDAALSGQGPNPWLAFGVALLTLLLFVSYSRSADQIAARLNAEQGKGAAAQAGSTT